MTSSIESKQYSDPSAALQLAQKAPVLLAKSSSISTTFPWSMIGTPESPETWMDLAELFYACLQTGDDKSAHLCLEKLTQRFGAKNERVMAMRGLYQEAVAENEDTLASILQDYNNILKDNPMNVPLHKRRIALARAMNRHHAAIAALVDFLESFPSDVEAWCELSDLYLSQGLGAQAIFSLEEALLSAPNAWNLHARLGELEYMNALASNEESGAVQKSLVLAVQRFCRSIELCDDYLRGYYGLKLTTAKLLQNPGQTRSGSAMPVEKAQKLNNVATKKLEELVHARTKQPVSETSHSEVIAAQALLNSTKS